MGLAKASRNASLLVQILRHLCRAIFGYILLWNNAYFENLLMELFSCSTHCSIYDYHLLKHHVYKIFMYRIYCSTGIYETEGDTLSSAINQLFFFLISSPTFVLISLPPVFSILVPWFLSSCVTFFSAAFHPLSFLNVLTFQPLRKTNTLRRWETGYKGGESLQIQVVLFLCIYFYTICMCVCMFLVTFTTFHIFRKRKNVGMGAVIKWQPTNYTVIKAWRCEKVGRDITYS